MTEPLRPECPRCRGPEAGTVPKCDPLAFVCKYCQYIWDGDLVPPTKPAPEPVTRDGAVVGHIHRKSNEPKPKREKLATGEDLAKTVAEAAGKHALNPAVVRLMLKAFDHGYRTGVRVTLADIRRPRAN